MKKTIRRMTHHLAHSLVSAMLLMAAATTVYAQTYPNKPIRLLVGYSAGGGVDAMARLLAPRLTTLLGQPVVVDNRAGAAGLIAGDAAAKAKPDGYTLILGDSSMLIAQHLQPKMSFDPLKDFAPIAAVFNLPLMIVTTNNFPAKTPKEFLATLKSSPGKYSFASSGVGTVQHLGFEMLKGASGSFVVHIPYRGAAQIVPDVISGQVPIAVISATAALAQAKAGKLQAIAVMSQAKLVGAENVPPLADALPGFDAAPLLFVLAPSGTPAPMIEKLNDAIREVMLAADMPQVAALQGAVPAYMSSGQLASAMSAESANWRKIVREQKISVE